MKKIIVTLFIIFTLSLTGCSSKINLDNIESFETDYEYSKVSMGAIKECEEDKVIQEAKEFANKFFAIMYNRSYKDNTSIENETIMFSEEYKANNPNLIENIEFIKEFYNKYGLETEVQNVDFDKIININGDAYANATAKIRLTACSNPAVASILGFKDGLNSNIRCEYNIKMKYVEREYFVYDYELVPNEGYLLDFASYETKLNENLTVEEKLDSFVYAVSKAQNDRIYDKFTGDEDYIYLSQAYKDELNKERDDVKYTKEIYTRFQLSTEFISSKVNSVTKTDSGYTLNVTLVTKLLNCISDDVAKNIGYPDGVGSESEMTVEYYVVEENGEFKLNGSKQI